MDITDNASLRARIRELHQDHPGRHDIAEIILAENHGDIDALRVIARVSLVNYVAGVIRRPEAHVTNHRADAAPHPVVVGAKPPKPGARVAPVFKDRWGNEYDSPHRRELADLFYERTAISVKCGPDKTDEKRLYDLNAAQLRFAAGIRHQQAAASTAVAQTYERLADALEKVKADTVRQLDPRIGLDILTGPAAEGLRKAG